MFSMHDSLTTPTGTDTALKESTETLRHAMSNLGLNHQASLSEVVRHVPRLLNDASVAAMTGNRGDAFGVLLSLINMHHHARQIISTADATIQQVLAEYPELVEHDPRSGEKQTEHDPTRQTKGDQAG